MPQKRANELFHQYIWPLRATVLRTATFLCRNSSDADDLAQETLLKAFRAIDQFATDSNPQSWLLTILRNTRIDKLRSAKSREPTVSFDAADLDFPDDALPDNPRSEEDLRQIAQLIEGFSDQTMIDALKTLPEEIRWTLLLADVEQLDYVQAAEVLGVPVGTVKSRVHRGRQMLKTALVKGTLR
jgi:RNA polymerase sigma-70 factor, ECF subfamily